MLILYVYCDIVGYKKKQPDSLPSAGETYIDCVQKITSIRHYHNSTDVFLSLQLFDTEVW